MSCALLVLYFRGPELYETGLNKNGFSLRIALNLTAGDEGPEFLVPRAQSIRVNCRVNCLRGESTVK